MTQRNLAPSVRQRTWRKVLYILGLIFCLGTAAVGLLFGSCGTAIARSPADRMFFRNLLVVAGLAMVTAIFLLVKVIVLTREGP